MPLMPLKRLGHGQHPTHVCAICTTVDERNPETASLNDLLVGPADRPHAYPEWR